MRNIQIIFLILSVAAFVKAGENSLSNQSKSAEILTDSVKIQKWFDAKGSAFTFTFDEYAWPVLNSFGYKGTFYVITGSLTDTLPAIWRYGTWQQFKELHDYGNEIGSHTVTHPYLTQLDPGDTLTPGTIEYEVYQSKKTIDSIITDTKCITFAYPYVDYDSIVVGIVKKYYESARGMNNNPNPSSLYGDQYYTLKSKEIDFDLPRNTPADDENEFVDATNWIQSSIDSSGWAIIMIHEVYPFDSLQIALNEGSWYPMTVEWLTQLCEWIQNKDIWVATAADITKYMRERESAQYEIISQSDASVRMNLTDTLGNNIYNFPLTLDIPIPNNWDSTFVYQDGNFKSSYIVDYNGVKYARTNVIPDGGEIMILNSPITIVKNNGSLPDNFRLSQNYPNPFNPSTIIKFNLPDDQPVSLAVYDILGREVRILINNQLYKSGNHEVKFDGSSLPSGIYFYRLFTPKFSGIKKMMLVK